MSGAPHLRRAGRDPWRPALVLGWVQGPGQALGPLQAAQLGQAQQQRQLLPLLHLPSPQAWMQAWERAWGQAPPPAAPLAAAPLAARQQPRLGRGRGWGRCDGQQEVVGGTGRALGRLQLQRRLLQHCPLLQHWPLLQQRMAQGHPRQRWPQMLPRRRRRR